MKFWTVLKNIALFFLAPFIALGYLFALPAVGFYMFIRLVIEVVHQKMENSNEHSGKVSLER